MSPSHTSHIYLLGILERSGTNFLYNTLIQHSEISPMSPKGEDYLLKSIELLDEYCRSTSSHWHSMWGGGLKIEQQRKDLQRALGKGMNIYLQGEESETEFICSKTPSTIGIEAIQRYFPESKVILLVREPVKTVSSGVESFGWTWRQGIKDWKQSAERMIDFMNREETTAHLVRYEDLIHQPGPTLEGISDFLGIDRTELSASTIKNQPVVGSSTLGNSSGEIKWEGVQADITFQPTSIAGIPAWAVRKAYRATDALRKQLGYHQPPPVPDLSISDHIQRLTHGIQETVIDGWRALRAKYLT